MRRSHFDVLLSQDVTEIEGAEFEEKHASKMVLLVG